MVIERGYEGRIRRWREGRGGRAPLLLKPLQQILLHISSDQHGVDLEPSFSVVWQSFIRLRDVGAAEGGEQEPVQRPGAPEEVLHLQLGAERQGPSLPLLCPLTLRRIRSLASKRSRCVPNAVPT